MRRKINRMLSFGLALIMMFSIAGCGSNAQPQAEIDPDTPVSEVQFPLKETEELSFITSAPATSTQDPNERIIFQRLEEQTNVHIKWTCFVSDQFSDKKNLALAQFGNLPDGLFNAGMSDYDLLRYAKQGIIIPLENLIDKYMPNLQAVFEKYPEYRTMCTAPDGHIYSFPWIEQLGAGKEAIQAIGDIAYINKKWLDAVGADIPTTTEEFEAVLKKFKEEDPNGNGEADEIPMTFMFSDWGASDHGPYFGAFGYPLSPDYIMIDNKEVKYLGAQDSFKKGAEWLGKLYGEGLVDRDIFTQDSSGMTAKISQGTVGVFSAWDITDAGEHTDEYVVRRRLKGPDGEQNALVEWITGFYKGRFMITEKAKNPEILMQWIDRFYENMETGLNATYGIGPDKEKAWYYDDNNNIIFKKDTELPEDQIRGQQQLPFAPAILGAGVEDFLGNPAKNEINAQMKQYAGKFEDGTWERWPSCYMTVEEKEDIATTETDLQVYSKNQLAKWIAGESDVNADWDNYLKELENVGLSHYLEVKQQIFDRYDSAE